MAFQSTLLLYKLMSGLGGGVGWGVGGGGWVAVSNQTVQTSRSDGLQPTSSDTRSEAIPFPRSEANYFLRSEATSSPSQVGVVIGGGVLRVLLRTHPLTYSWTARIQYTARSRTTQQGGGLEEVGDEWLSGYMGLQREQADPS